MCLLISHSVTVYTTTGRQCTTQGDSVQQTDSVQQEDSVATLSASQVPSAHNSGGDNKLLCMFN